MTLYTALLKLAYFAYTNLNKGTHISFTHFALSNPTLLLTRKSCYLYVLSGHDFQLMLYKTFFYIQYYDIIASWLSPTWNTRTHKSEFPTKTILRLYAPLYKAMSGLTLRKDETAQIVPGTKIPVGPALSHTTYLTQVV